MVHCHLVWSLFIGHCSSDLVTLQHNLFSGHCQSGHCSSGLVIVQKKLDAVLVTVDETLRAICADFERDLDKSTKSRPVLDI